MAMKAKVAIVKEVRIAPKIDDHDLDTKTRQAGRFLEAGDKVKISVLFRGREMLHQEIGRGLLDRMIAQLGGISTVESTPRMEGRMMSAMLAPRELPKERPAASIETAGVASQDGSVGSAAPE